MDTPKAQENRDSIHRKKQEFVRHELWVAATEMFFVSGFDETTIEQIAARANVSRRTFFRYFSSKEDVMAHTIKGYGAALVHALHDQPEDLSPLEAARAVVKRVARLAADHPHSDRTLTIIARSPSARSAQLLQLPMIEDELTQAFATRGHTKPNDDLTNRLLASLTLSITTLTIHRWLERKEQPVEDTVDGAFASLSQVFCAKL
jgi:AcrR family transcriptional regulator